MEGQIAIGETAFICPISTQVPKMAAGQPTPWMGLVECVSVYSPLLWVLALAVVLLRTMTQA